MHLQQRTQLTWAATWVSPRPHTLSCVCVAPTGWGLRGWCNPTINP